MTLLIFLVVLVFIFDCFKDKLKAKVKGKVGESLVGLNLSILPKNKYRILNDIMLRTGYGTTQIDHIVVSIYGIFVIETKNYKGWITGGEFSEKWTKNMYGNKYEFLNPLKQNYAHVKALESKLKLNADCFIPIVAFSSDADIKVQSSKPVIYIGQVSRFIKSYKETKFDEMDLDAIVLNIMSNNITDKDSRKGHVIQIKEKIKDNDEKIEHNICPKCGGELVERKGKYGSFIGCANYPKCKYTKQN